MPLSIAASIFGTPISLPKMHLGRMFRGCCTFGIPRASNTRAAKSASRRSYTYPNDKPGHPSNIGTIYTRDELTRNLHQPYPEIPEWDTNGHGTSCAGIAAGNGQGGPKDEKGKPLFAGVAPDADIIGVRIGTGENLENAYLLGAICEWLNKIAGDRPVVISCSFGGHDGGHDGYLVEEREIDARFPLSTKGRAICIAAGNEGQEHFHADVFVSNKDNPAILKWKAAHNTELKIYFQTNDLSDLQVDTDKSSGIVANSADITVHPLTTEAILSVTVQAGDGQLALYTDSGRTIAADAYLTQGVDAEFAAKDNDSTPTGYSPKNQLGTPGTTGNAITVGSYDWNDRFNRFGKVGTLPPAQHLDKDMSIGGLSDYSNPGYRRIGELIKPEIVAPGQWFTAPAALNVPADRDFTGLYQQFAGTSAATPYTAGVVALLMQKNPKITLGEIRDTLEKNATAPDQSVDKDHSGQMPNPFYGYGKLDRAAVARMLGVKP